MREIDVRRLGRERVICCFALDGVIVDPGPESSHRTLLEALGDEVPRAILLTNIHLDHAGATGALVRLWPGAREGVNALIRNPAASSGSVYLGATNVNTATGFELWLRVPDEHRREAHRLVFKTGHLTRRRTDDHLVYRLSDEALIAQQLHQLTDNISPN